MRLRFSRADGPTPRSCGQAPSGSSWKEPSTATVRRGARFWRAAAFPEGGGRGAFEVVVRREVAAGGKGRLLVNGSPAALKTLQEIAPRLLVLHGQAEARELLDPDAPCQLLDCYAGLAEKAASTAALFREWRVRHSRKSAAV